MSDAWKPVGAEEIFEAEPAGRSRWAVGGWLRRGFGAAVDLVWPPVCIHCEAATGVPHGLCAKCWARLGFITRPYCERMGTPFAVDLGGPLLSPAAIAQPPAYDRARAVCRYDEVARRLVQRLKYGDRLELAVALGGMMAKSGRELLADADVIIPMPLHYLRFWRRQFNQATLLAGVIARESKRPLEPGLLQRRKATVSQVGLTRAERAANVSGAFRAPAEMRPRVRGRRVLLVDDVVTTGATVNAAAATLLRAGASAVDVLSFARVVADGN